MSCSIAVPVAFAAPVAPVARRARTVARATPFVGTTSAFAARSARVTARRSVQVFASDDKTTEFEVPAAMTDTLDKVSAAWEKTEDKPAVATLGVFALIGLVALAGVLKAVDSLPLVPTLLELVGIAYTAWFTYRYLLFKPDRAELKAQITKLTDSILG